MYVCVHYLDSIVKHKRGIYGVIQDNITKLNDYHFDKNFECPFINKKGGYVKIIKHNKIKYKDVYIII